MAFRVARQACRLAGSPRHEIGSISSTSKRLNLNPVLTRALSQDLRKRIDGLIKEKPLVLFMKGSPDYPQCGFSRGVVQVLAAQDVQRESLATHNILEDQELRDGIKEYSEWPTIPQLYLDGEFLGGCDIILDMYKNGSLEPLLVEKGVIPPAEKRAPSEHDRLNG